MTIFECSDYKVYLRKRFREMPKHGRGEIQKISQFLRIHSTRLSHVFSGDEHLTLEQGLGLTKYLGLSEFEAEYFMVLLEHAKAGTHDLKMFFEKKRSQLLERSSQLVERLPSDRKLSESERAIFYSNWYYSAIRLNCSLAGRHNIDTISSRFGIPREKVAQALEFLVSTGLCVAGTEGSLGMGAKSTHLEARSPLVSRLHANWRIKAMEKHPTLGQEELAFTSPMSIEAKDVSLIRETLVQMIEKATAYADTSRPDALYCLNVDWFAF